MRTQRGASRQSQSTARPRPPSSRGGQAKSPNEGEGSRSAARDYNQRTARFIREGKVGKSAEEAKRAVEGAEREDLLNAEATGRARRRS